MSREQEAYARAQVDLLDPAYRTGQIIRVDTHARRLRPSQWC